MRARILPYRTGSSGARELSRALGVLRVNPDHNRRRFRPRPGDVIINWGSRDMVWSDMAEDHVGFTILNSPFCVGLARNKLDTFRELSAKGVPTVEWTEHLLKANEWFAAGENVFVRTTLTGQGGAGIVVQNDQNSRELLPAPLYTRHWRAEHEYRVHVVGEETFVTKKRRRNGAERSLVRNHTNGYVYCTTNVEVPLSAVSVARAAITALGLCFGAVDLLVSRDGEARVLEVNTAPGLEGRTVDWYANAFRKLLEG